MIGTDGSASGARPADAAPRPRPDWLTVPNLVSLARLLLVPVFAVLALNRDMREAFALCQQVTKIESRADDVFKESYLLLLDLDIDYKTFVQANAIIDRLESMADTCSQNAELLRHLVLEYIE